MFNRTQQRAERIATLVIEKERILQKEKHEIKIPIYRQKTKIKTILQPTMSKLGFHDTIALFFAAFGALHEVGHTFLHINLIAGISNQEIANVCSILFLLSALYLIAMRGYFYKQSWFFRSVES